jgi:RHS repeat-associated protein
MQGGIHPRSAQYMQRAKSNFLSIINGSTGYTYDKRDRLQLKTVAWSSGPTISLNYQFDASGNLTNLWSSPSSGGVTNFYQFDALNRLTNVVANGSAAAGYGFDGGGNLQSIQYGNGVTSQFQYDVLNRLTNAVWKTNAGTIASFYYQLGAAGNRTNLTETLLTVITNRTYAWSYDPLYRLKQETLSVPNVSLSYGFDLVGNRMSRTISGSLNLTNQSFTFNTNDWVTSDSYDNNGNSTGSSGNSYQFDVLNRMTNMNSGAVLIWYDGDGNRMKKTVGSTTTYYLVDDRNPSGYAQVLEEWTASGGTTNLSRVYNYGLQLISQRQPNVSTNYFVFDGHGSTRVLTDNGGKVVNAFTFDAYGNLIASNTAPQTVYLFAGEQRDPDLGMDYLRYRTSNPNTGRFPTADSLDGSKDDPLSLHRYLFCHDDPINRIDPSGHEDLIELMSSAAIDVGLSTMLAVGINYAAEKVGYSLLPGWVKQAMKTTVTVDAFEVGVSASYNIPVGKYPIGIAPGGGIELLVSPKTRGAALYGYAGGTLSIGKGQTRSGGASASFGLVFNTPTSQNYTELFYTESIPYKAFPPQVKSKIDAFLASGFGSAFTGASSEAIEEFKSIGGVLSGVLDRGTANVFFDPTGGGSWGISFSYAAGPPDTTAGPPSFSLTWYWQLLPRHDQEVKFR